MMPEDLERFILTARSVSGVYEDVYQRYSTFSRGLRNRNIFHARGRVLCLRESFNVLNSPTTIL